MIGNLPTLAVAAGAFLLGALFVHNALRAATRRVPIRVRTEHPRR